MRFIHLTIVASIMTAIFLPNTALAQEPTVQEEIFRAKVMEIVDERNVEAEDGAVFHQQNLRIKGLDGERANQEILIEGISDFQVVEQNIYREDDKVLVGFSPGPSGDAYYIVDYVRTGPLLWLLGLFILVVLLIGRWKGARSLVVLVLTLLIILKFIVPAILAGHNPLLISVIGSTGILFLAIYVVEGFKKRSHVAFASVLVSLCLALVLSWLFTNLTRLTGLAAEEAMYLLEIGGVALNMKGLLLAGIIIGTLGVLDDVVINQVSVIKELREADAQLSDREVFKKAMRVGVDHINAIVNTLFLAYAGVALPLLILFSVKTPPLLTFGQIVNNEMLATEIVRTLIGSIALVLSVPISTWMAAKLLQKKEGKYHP